MKDVKKQLDKLMPYLVLARKYLHFIYFIFLALLCGFLIYQIRGFAQVEPTEDAVTDKLKTVQRPRIDQNALSKIQQLQDQNIQVKTLFDQARDNPFSE